MTSEEIYELTLELQKKPSNYDSFIETVEANMSIIDNDIVNNNSETYLYTTMIISHYAEILYRKNRYRKALPVLDKAISLWENNSKYENIDLENEWYLALNFHRGIANYRRNNIKKAKEEFTWLTTYDPENEQYREWMIGIKNHILGTIANSFFYFGIVLIGIDILMPKQERNIRGVACALVGVVYLLGSIFKLIQWVRNKRMNKMFDKDSE